MDRFIKGFFWFAFATFLGASIPHVAYFFASFEAMGNPVVSWTIAYAIAISIDVTIYLLTIAITRLQKGVGVWAVWGMIIGLTLLSWYINLQYAEQFASGMLSKASPFVVQGIDINPLIASMFQVLVIAYTGISAKITAPVQGETLEQKAERLEREREYKRRIAETRKGVFTSKIKDGIGSGIEIAKYASNALQSQQERQEAPLPATPQPSTTVPQETSIQPVQEQETPIEVDPVRLPNQEGVTEPLAVVDTNPVRLPNQEGVPSTNGHGKVVLMYQKKQS